MCTYCPAYLQSIMQVICVWKRLIADLHSCRLDIQAKANICEAAMARVAMKTHARGPAAEPGDPLIPDEEPYHIIDGCGLVPDTRYAIFILAASGGPRSCCWTMSLLKL